jgi:hypothetical protein
MGYYMGDPGFFSIVKSLGSSLLGLAPGGGVAGKLLGGAGRISTIARKGAGTILRHPVISAAGGAAVVGLGAGALGGRALLGGGACPKGFHISKSKHSPHFGACVRNRRMRVTNPKALRRAIRRAHGFARLARKVLSFTSPRKHKGRMYFKKRSSKK